MGDRDILSQKSWFRKGHTAKNSWGKRENAEHEGSFLRMPNPGRFGLILGSSL